jgi:hypothetical protein
MRIAVTLAGLAVFFTAGATASVPPPDLYAWARIDKPIVGVSRAGLTFGRPVARHLAPGRYRLHVAARSDLAFHLVGPGIDRQTPFTADTGAPIYRTWSIRLRHGRYLYSAEGLYAKELRAAGVPVRGAFSVP